MSKKAFKKIKRLKNKAGIPGKMVYTGSKTEQNNQLEYLLYTAETVEQHLINIDALSELKTDGKVLWLNSVGLADINSIEAIGQKYALHPLVLEDIVNVHQRPNIVEYEDYVFISLKMIYFSEDVLVYEPVSFIMGSNYVISFQENSQDVFQNLRERIVHNTGKVRRAGADYLLFALLDAVVDHYFEVIENLGETIQEIEDRLFKALSNSIPEEILSIKKEIFNIRKLVNPLREMIPQLMLNPMLEEASQKYYKDLFDHVLHVQETIDLHREMTTGLIEMHATQLSNRMNNVMKTLTLVASIFIPLTFIAGVYGMNFENMPELSLEYGYYYALGGMALLGVVLVVVMLRKKWF
ncbi:MAG: magnesium/cobalt transporter CorA [Flavobacteriaceae bacterium]|nr:magnesium/cobalt transporter CorA [Flavobacteriaceae bacterium]